MLKAVFGIAKDASSNYVIVSSRAESLDLECLLYALLIRRYRRDARPRRPERAAVPRRVDGVAVELAAES